MQGQEPSAAVHVQPLALSCKADVSRTHVNHARGLKLVQPQDLNHHIFVLTYAHKNVDAGIINIE